MKKILILLFIIMGIIVYGAKNEIAVNFESEKIMTSKSLIFIIIFYLQAILSTLV